MLHINDLEFTLEGRKLFDGASAHIPASGHVGLVGRNGTGKTTLLRLIRGTLAPDGGSVRVRQRARLGWVDQEAPAGEVPVMDFVLSQDTERASLLEEAETATEPNRIAEIQTRLADIEAYSAEARAGAILNGLGFSHEQQSAPCKTFSGGWRMRVALAGALFARPDLLLLDEPTNYLDLEGAVWLERHLSRFEGAALIISHDRSLLNNACDRILHLMDGKLTAYEGGYDDFERQLEERQRLDLKLRDKQEEEKRRLGELIDRFRYKASKARQAQSWIKRMERMKPVATSIAHPVAPFFIPESTRRMSPPLVRFDHATLGYEPGKPVLRDISLLINGDDRIGLLGRNGSGKSTLIKALTSLLPPQEGRVGSHKKLQIAYFAQHALDALNPKKSAYEHVVELMPEATEAQRRAKLGSVGLPQAKGETPAGELSGGEKTRLLMFLATFEGAHFLVFDEPTNHLDIDSRAALADAINNFPGAAIIISHDFHFLASVSDRLWLVENGGVEAFDGDLDDYRRYVLRGEDNPDGPAKPQKSEDARSVRRRDAAARRAEIAPLKKRTQDIEKKMEKLRAEIEELDGLLAAPDLYEKQPAAAAKLSQSRGQTVKKLEELETEWLEAAETYEQAKAEIEA